MTCKLLKDIKHSCEYNAGGIAEIVVLDINDFVSYTFTEDRLYDSCLVEEINTKSDSVLVSLDVVSESSFTEQEANGIYTQNLSTFVRSLGHENLERLLRAKASKLLVMFRTHQGTWFTFGSDCGAALTFEQISGQLGESSGYKITIKANSIYPLFELNGEPNIVKPTEPEEEILPDPFVKGRKDKLYFITDTDWMQHYNNWWDPINYDTPDLERGLYTEGTHETQEVDELWWTRSIKLTSQEAKHGTDPSFLKNYDVSPENLTKIFGREVDYSRWLDMAGGYTYYADGIHWWEKMFALNDVWHAYELRTLNDNITTTPVVIAEEADESTLTSTVTRAFTNPYSHLFFQSLTPIDFNIPAPFIFKKFVCFFAEAGKIQLTIEYRDGTSENLGEFETVEGRNEIIFDKYIAKDVKFVGFGLNAGTLKVDKTKSQHPFGNVRYRKDRWDYGTDGKAIDPSSYIYSWSFGFGLEVELINKFKENVTLDWGIPEVEDMLQLIGQAPDTSDDIFRRMIDFCMYTDEDNVIGSDPIVAVQGNLLKGDKNTSGLTFFPSGFKENKKAGADEPYWDVLASGYLFNMSVGHYTDNIKTRRVFNMIKGSVGGKTGLYFSPVYGNVAHPYGSRQLRYAKRKTNGELGYKMYIDEENDKILMLPYNANKDQIIRRLPLGQRLDDDGVWNNLHIGLGTSFQANVEGAKAVYIKQWINHDGRNIHFLDKDNNIIQTILHDNPDNPLKQVEGRYLVPESATTVVWFTVDPLEIYCDVEYADYTKDPRYSLPELPKGLLRGIALRYANRKHMKVCKSLSELRAEENEIMSQIDIDN